MRKLTRKSLLFVLPGLLLLPTPQVVRADAPPVRNGVIAAFAKVEPGSLEEAQMLLQNAPRASDYPNAAVAFLLDLMDIEVRPDGSARSVTRVTKKVFNKRGRDDESEVKIGYNSHYETIRILRARTIKPDGTIVNVRPEDIRDSRPSDYDDVAVKAFSLPAVDDDCIIDYEYETVQKESLMPGQFWQSWYFQGGFDPVMQTRLTVTVPKSLALKEQLKNTALKPTVKEINGGKMLQYVWEDKNVAPLETEPLMPSADKVLPQLNISTVPTWQSVARWFYELSKDRYVADAGVKARTRELTLGKQTPEDKARAIFYYVQDKTRYVAISLGKGAYQPRPALKTLNDQFGDCKDMSALLVSMLREAGIKAYPALLKMDSKDKRSAELPSPGAFDHMVCLAEIGDKQYWLDATGGVLPWGMIPVVDRGCEALVIKDNGEGVWETIPMGTADDNKSERIVRLTLSPDGSASGSITMMGNGDTDLEYRSVLRDFPVNKISLLLKGYAGTVGTNPRVSNVKVSNARDLDTPVTMATDVSFPTYASQSGDLLLFKARPDQTTGSSSSPFSEDFRKLPIKQAAPAAGVATLELTLPNGYEVIGLPKDIDIKSDLGRFVRTVKQDGQKLTITIRGENYPAEIPPSGYEAVRDYYAKYLRASEEWVVIRKQ